MHPLALAMVVVAAVAHAGWNLFAKRVSSGGAAFIWLYSALISVLCLPAGAALLLTGERAPTTGWAAAVALSGLLHTLYFLLLQRGYAKGDLSVVYPLARGTGPLLTVLVAVAVLGERPGPVALAGAGLVVAGIAVIGAGGFGRRAVPTGGVTRRGRHGAWYGLATGGLIAVYTLWDAHAVTTLAVPPVVLVLGAAPVEVLLLTPVALRRRSELGELWRSHRSAVIAVAVLSPLAYLLVLFAVRLAPVSMAAPARELSIVFAGLAGWLLLGEPNPARRMTGSLVVLAGITAIAVA